MLAAGAYSLLDLASFHQPQAKRFLNERQQYQAARGGIEYLLELLAAEEPDLLAEFSIEAGRQLEIGGVPVAVSIEDEGSKINVNAATEKLLLGLDLSRAQVESLLDWRDVDSDPWPSGAEAEYYNAETDLTPRDGLLPTTEELFLVRHWQGEEELIRRHLTVYGPMNVNQPSPDSLDALPGALAVDKFTSQSIVNDFLAAKMRGQLFPDLESFFGSLPSLGPLLGEELAEHLTAEPVVNVNTATPRVLSAWCHYLDLAPSLADWIVESRKSIPFTDLAPLLSRVPREQHRLITAYFTTESRIFSLAARAGRHQIRAVVQQKDEELAILAWQERTD